MTSTETVLEVHGPASTSETPFGKLTFGLPSKLVCLFNWALEKRVLPSLALLCEATNCFSHPVYLGTALAFLRTHHVANCLANWKYERPFLTDVKRLQDAYSISNDVSKLYPPMPKQAAAHKQLDGLLRELPLLALLVRHAEVSSSEDFSWFETLRAWCLIQHLDAVYSGRPVGRNLTTVTEKIRISVDKDGGWGGLILKLKGPTDTLAELTLSLKERAEFILQQSDPHELRPAHKEFLRALKKVSSAEDTADATASENKTNNYFAELTRFAQQNTTVEALSLPRISDSNSLTSGHSAKIGELTYDADETESTLGIVDVDELDTPLQQTRKSQGVLLGTAEEHQFLNFSWDKPAPHEITVLLNWIEITLGNPNNPDQPVAFAAWLALQTGHSIRTVLNLEFADQPSNEWSIQAEPWAIARMAPKRYNGWSAQTEHLAWIKGRAQVQYVVLPEHAQRLLNRLQKEAGPLRGPLLDVLPDAKNVESTFNAACKKSPGLNRILSGMLRAWLAHQVFEKSKDSTQALLLASHPRSGLPGSCAYASFTATTVAQSLSLTTHVYSDPPHTAGEELNSGGSELDPIDSLLTKAFKSALDRVNELSSKSEMWIEYHNALTGYCVVALLAASGARPINSPFEALDHFDLARGLMYVDDKNTNNQHQGRLVPLPNAAVSLIKNCYLPHLQYIQKVIGQFDSSFADRIAELTHDRSLKTMPLFFFLGKASGLDWLEVSETTLDSIELFDWPLPWNLMRHRLSTRLRHKGVNPEIVDGLLGHSEQATAAYSYYSLRNFAKDCTEVQPTLDHLYELLEIDPPKAPTWPVDRATECGPSSKTSTAETRRYGASARREHRLNEHRLVKKSTTIELETWRQARPLESLTATEWEQLAQSMLLLPNGMPHPKGSLRYETFLSWINQQWDDQALRPRIKRRYLPALEEPSVFSELSLKADGVIDGVRRSLQPLIDTPISRISMKDARILGCIGLMLDARLADMDVIKDTARRKNIRLSHFDGQHHLEHSVGLNDFLDAPVRRYWISPQITQWLLKSFESETNHNFEKPLVSDVWRDCHLAAQCEAATTNAFELLAVIAKYVQLSNAMHMPGPIAAYLNGHLVTAALSHQDWYRVNKGVAIAAPQLRPFDASFNMSDADKAPAQEDECIVINEMVLDDGFNLSTESIFSGNSGTTVIPDTPSALDEPVDDPVQAWRIAHPDQIQDVQGDTLAAQKSAQRFFRNIRSAIDIHSKNRHSSRRDLDVALRKILDKSLEVSPTCRLLGEWTRSLLWRKTRRGALKLSSVARYLNALSSCFEAEAYNHNLFNCESEELTAFYTRILESRRLIKHASSPETAEKTITTTEGIEQSSDAYRTWRLAASLLKDFHRVCAKSLALEEPDWSEVMSADVPLSISPGLILEAEYLQALRILVGDVTHATFQDLSGAFILMLCYRFGLRGKEAIGLMRNDWLTPEGGGVVVLVRSNRIRSLKTTASRRMVPLIFTLSSLEDQLVDKYMTLWSGISIDEPRTPLFCDANHPTQMVDDLPLRRKLSLLIKQVTCNQDLSLHHARHTFANQAALLLFDYVQPLWKHASSSHIDAAQSLHVRRLLMSTTEPNRRTSWALARLLGHSHPRTSYQSYLHLLCDLSSLTVRSTPSDLGQFKVDLARTLDLDASVALDCYLDEPPQQKEHPLQLSMTGVLRFFRMYQKGSAISFAAEATHIPLVLANDAILKIQMIERVLEKRDSINPLLGGRSRLLSHIPPHRWKFWLDRASNIPDIHLKSDATGDDPQCPMLPVAPSRQVILYQREHFENLGKLLKTWQIDTHELTLIQSNKIDPRLPQWATEFDFSSTTQEAYNSTGTKVQLDTATAGDPPMTVKHRCVVIPNSHVKSSIESTFELIFLLLTASVFEHQPL